MPRKEIIKIVLVLLVLILGFYKMVLAQGLQLQYPQLPGAPTIQPGRISLPDFLRYLYQFLLLAGASVAILVILSSGLLYLTSSANPPQQKEAKNYLIASSVGLLLLFGSYVILRVLDPTLILLPGSFSQAPPPLEPLTPISQVEIEKPLPKSYTVLTTFEEDSDRLAEFLKNKILELVIIELLDTQGFLQAIAKAKDANCQDSGQTYCVPKTDSSQCLAVNCVWKENPEKVLLNKVKDALIGIDKLRKIMKEIIESKEAKKVKGDLNELERCQQDFTTTTSLLLQPQAKEKGFLDHFKIGGGKVLDFYCFFP